MEYKNRWRQLASRKRVAMTPQGLISSRWGERGTFSCEQLKLTTRDNASRTLPPISSSGRRFERPVSTDLTGQEALLVGVSALSTGEEGIPLAATWKIYLALPLTKKSTRITVDKIALCLPRKSPFIHRWPKIPVYWTF